MQFSPPRQTLKSVSGEKGGQVEMRKIYTIRTISLSPSAIGTNTSPKQPARRDRAGVLSFINARFSYTNPATKSGIAPSRSLTQVQLQKVTPAPASPYPSINSAHNGTPPILYTWLAVVAESVLVA